MHDYDILQMDELARKEQIKKDAEKIGRPTLVRRLGSGMLDVLFVTIVFFALMVFAAGVLFEPFGYDKATDTINSISKQSGLYVEKGGLLFSVHDAYDEEKTAAANYDAHIVYFYTTDANCIAQGKLESYIQAKEQSNLFAEDASGNLLPKEPQSDEIRTFYQQQYDKAVDFLATRPEYIQAVNKTFGIMMSTIFVALLIATGVFYFLFPLVLPRGETLGQLICKVCLIDSRNNYRAHKWQIFLRSLAVVVINFFLPIAIYVVFASITLAPIILSVSIMCLTKYNKGPQDYVSQTHVVLRHHAEMAWSQK